jgi:putative transposase
MLTISWATLSAWILRVAARMARRRLFVPGCSQHVCHRGNNRGDIFRDEGDRVVFLKILAEAAAKNGVEIGGYALMGNHYHALVTPPDEGALPNTMQRLGRGYVRYFNDKYRRTGTLWEGRYRSSVILDERYWLTCLRYIELNAVAAKLVTQAHDYEWSSYRHHAYGLEDALLAPHPLFTALGRGDGDRQQAWRYICDQMVSPEDEALIVSALRSAGALHAPGFVYVPPPED